MALSAIVLTLMLEVPPLLGTSESYHSSDLLSACLPQPSFRSSVCHAGIGKSFGGRDFLLRTANSSIASL